MLPKLDFCLIYTSKCKFLLTGTSEQRAAGWRKVVRGKANPERNEIKQYGCGGIIADGIIDLEFTRNVM